MIATAKYSTTYHMYVLTDYSYIDVRTYVDDNECAMEDNGGCSQNCTNTLGSYRCSCYEGYSLNIDGVSCSGKQINISYLFHKIMYVANM